MLSPNLAVNCQHGLLLEVLWPAILDDPDNTIVVGKIGIPLNGILGKSSGLAERLREVLYSLDTCTVL